MNMITPLSLDTSKPWHGEEIPDERFIPEPDRFLLLVKQLGIKRKIGSIELPDQLVDAQSYTHGMGLVVKVGPCVYKGRKFEDMGATEEMGPKVGDIVTFEARGAPRRIWIKGVELLFIMDDQITSRPTPEQVPHISFKL